MRIPEAPAEEDGALTLHRRRARSNRITITVLVILLLGRGVGLSGPAPADGPGLHRPDVQVVTRFPGASPERVEQLVSDPIEQAVQAMPELDYVSSTSRTGVSIVVAAIREEFKNVRPIFDSLRRKVHAVELPAGVRIRPRSTTSSATSIRSSSPSAPTGFRTGSSRMIAKNIRDQLLQIDGVGKVDISRRAGRAGVRRVQRRAAVAARPVAGHAFSGACRLETSSLPGGQVDIGPEALVLEPSGNFDSIEDIRRTISARCPTAS